jgi:HAD superfamily hydrolase (TIGR01509 family)
MIRALIFDFDGLILDTEGPVFQSWQELYREYGCEISFEKWSTIIGTTEEWFDPLDDLESCLKENGKAAVLDRQEIKPRRLQRELDLVNSMPVQPGVREYLDAARKLGLKIGLASSSTCQWVTGNLKRLGLIDYFDDIQGKDDVERTKPDPELYLRTVEHLGVPVNEAVAFEDSPNGIRAAKKAGLFCVAVPNPLTKLLDINEADMRMETLGEMPLEELLVRVEKRFEHEEARDRGLPVRRSVN